MFIREFKNYSSSKRGITVFELKCDECDDIFLTKRAYARFRNTTIHFCNSRCSNASRKLGGKLQKKIEKTTYKRYGVKNSSQATFVKKKKRDASLKKYGTECVLQATVVKNKIKESNIKKYGVEYPTQLHETVEKRRLTCVKKYGVESYTATDEYKKRVKITNLKKYGKESFLQTKDCRAKTGSKEARIKAHETMKRRGSYTKSKTEDIFYAFLCTLFGKSYVLRQAIVNGWSIDFKVKNTLIQFDGVYWHGLDRDIEIIKEFNHKRDKVIYKTYLRDKVQQQWFSNNNISFLRITDLQFNEDIEKVKKFLKDNIK